MEYQKITSLLGTTTNEMPRFITKKWVEVHDQPGDANDRYKPNKPVRFKISMLRSDLCDFSDAYIVVKGNITLTKAANRDFIDLRDSFLASKKNAPFTNCISKINDVLSDNAGDLDIVMPMYNLFEYNKNFSKTIGRLWNYYKDELNNPPRNIYNADPITNSAFLNTKQVLQENKNCKSKKLCKY